MIRDIIDISGILLGLSIYLVLGLLLLPFLLLTALVGTPESNADDWRS